ncbi:MAG TPA: M20/M25/M40 family metallo-hydrolase [Kofleriaceae bacterium]|nr:M20/M25/M40 family metallo-hydrolase [Kofleriaceae bacterium]
MAPPEAPKHETPIADAYRETAEKIIAAARVDEGGWKKLAHLCDRIGHRISGSAPLEKAVTWAVEAMVADGHENVHAEKVMVPRWVRGAESAAMIAPDERPLAVLGLGGTIATPRRGLVGEVVVARDWGELDKLGAAGVKGKIVLFNHPMHPFKSQEEGPGYGEAVAYRNRGASRAAKLGAIATLVRSVTARSLRTPHTGATSFEKGQKPIPAAAVTVEDADMITRLVESGEKVRVRLTLSGKHHPDAPSANVLAELRGREKPEEVVVIGGHLDSWDVGQGAHDDGGGCVIAMQALSLLRQLGLTPRRTIRVVLWTAEENSGAGADEYVRAHEAELPNHVAGIEADTGVFAPIGFQIASDADGLRRLSDIVTLLGPLGAAKAIAGDSGADVEPMQVKGVPGIGLWMDESTYFDYHHTQADTLDKVDPEHLRADIAAVAVLAYVIADMPERLGKGPPPAEPEK